MTGPNQSWGGRRRPRAALAALAVGACAIALAACGSSSSSTTTSSAATSSAATSSAATSSAASSSGAPSGSPVKVAMITFKVPGEDQLTPMTAGADAAIKVINGEGGFGGHPVQLITCNSMLSPGPALDCAHSTVTQHPIAMIGCELAWSLGGLRVYTAANVPSLNCLNTQADFSSNWSFGMNPGASGDDAATIAYACSLPDVKTIADVTIALPAEIAVYNANVAPVAKACGKTPILTTVPTNVVDITPYVAKTMQSKPQFILSNVETAETEQLYSEFEGQGIPANRIAASDVDYTAALLKNAPAMKGGISIAEFNPWTDTSDPSIAQYVQALQSTGATYQDPNVEWGYSLMMWVYDSAKAAGFSNLTGTSLANYFRTANNVAIPLSRTWLNPGPSSAPAIKQPYARMLIWTGTTFTPVSGGDQGWFSGLK